MLTSVCCVQQGEREQSVAEVASIPEEVHSDEGEVQDNERMPHLDSVDASASLLPDDAFNASMSVEAFEGSISHADVLLPARQPATERVDSPEASPSRLEEEEGQEEEEAPERDEHATTEEALVENVQDAMADGSAVPLHLRMTDSRYSMSGMCTCSFPRPMNVLYWSLVLEITKIMCVADNFVWRAR